MTPDQSAVERLARIETNIERMAKTLEDIAQDHESRIRKLESQQERTLGVIKLFSWLIPALAAVALIFANKISN